MFYFSADRDSLWGFNARRVLDGRHAWRTRSGTGLITAERRPVSEGFLEAEDVVDVLAEVIEIGGEVRKGITSNGGPEFSLESAMNALDFPLCLRVIGASVDRCDAQANELGIEPAQGFGDGDVGAEGVVGQDRLREAELAEWCL